MTAFGIMIISHSSRYADICQFLFFCLLFLVYFAHISRHSSFHNGITRSAHGVRLLVGDASLR